MWVSIGLNQLRESWNVFVVFEVESKLVVDRVMMAVLVGRKEKLYSDGIDHQPGVEKGGSLESRPLTPVTFLQSCADALRLIVENYVLGE